MSAGVFLEREDKKFSVVCNVYLDPGRAIELAEQRGVGYKYQSGWTRLGGSSQQLKNLTRLTQQKLISYT